MAINYTQILEDRSSFQLVRTNPKLTGNVKFTVNGNDKMWLNSIDANNELSKDLYKRVAIDPTISLPGNIFKFFNNGSTPNEVVYEMKESFDSTKTSNDFKDQYDFSHYFSGAKYLVSKRYDEKMAYFAPLYLKKDVPEYFVIFKVNDPINRPISELKTDYPYDREKYIKELFQKASLIKTFDIRNTTTVGKYIRDYIEDDNFPTSPLTVNYDEDQTTDWNGILLNSGVMGTRGELLNDFYKQSNPLKHFEGFITGGYERNGVIIPNILNMEFIFDDDTSELYDFNRYIGFYVNAVELSKMEVDLGRGYDERGNWENTPAFRRKYQEWETINLDQHNDNGVIIPADNIDIYLSEFKNIFSDKDNMFFNYITDKNNNLYTPKLIDPFDIDYDVITGNERKRAKIRLSNTDIKLSDFYGPGEVFLQDEGFNSKVSGYSYAYIKIDKLSHLDEITIYHPNGTRINSNGRYDLLTGVNGYSAVPNQGDFYVFNDYDKSVGYDIFYFNIDGSPSDVVKAINGCLTGIRNSRFRVHSANEFSFIKLNIPNDVDETYRLEFNSPSGNYTRTIGTLIDVPRITINDVAGQDLINTISDFEGGSTSTRNRLIIDSGHYNKIKNNINDLLVKTSTGWSKISKISRYIDTVTESNVSTPSGRSSVIEDFLGKIAIILDLDIDAKVEYGNFMIKSKHKPAFGLLSFMHIKDFDFDFYSSEYLNFPEIDLYKTYFIPPNIKLLAEGETYEVLGEGTIRFNSSIINKGASFSVTSGQDLFYTIESGDPIVVTDKSGNFNAIHDENDEYKNFEGFFTLKDPSLVIPDDGSEIHEFRTRYINGIANSEYDYFKENNNIDFSLRSKILPYINKWVSTDGTDSRNNPYRLNGELMFGFNNFSPDHEDRSQNPGNFTHEWFYIESKFNYANAAETMLKNNSYFDEKFDLNKALTEEGYFTDYFTYTPSLNISGNGVEEIGETQTRYSPINRNRLGVYESLFKGFKIHFKDYIDSNNIDGSGKPEADTLSNRFEDYKFSCILIPKKEVTSRNLSNPVDPPIKYRMIEQNNFKFMLLIIEVSLGHIDSINSYWETAFEKAKAEIFTAFTSNTSGAFGTRFYDSSYISASYPTTLDNPAVGIIDNAGSTISNTWTNPTFAGVTYPLWGNLSSSGSNGRLHESGIWTKTPGTNAAAIDSNITFDVTVASAAVYMIGFGSIKGLSLTINGVNIHNSIPNLFPGYTQWSVVPVALNAGTNNITMEAESYLGLNTMGLEIYDATTTQLLAAATTSDIDAYIIFTTKDLLIGTNIAFYANPSTAVPVKLDRTNYNNVNLIDGTTMPYSTINGDYRIKFNSDVSDLDYTSIYALKHKKYNNALDNFSTVKLSSNLNLEANAATGAFANLSSIIPNIIISDIKNYPSKLSDEIHFPDTSNFIIAENLTSNYVLFVDQRNVTSGGNLNISRLISSTNSSVVMSTNLDIILVSDTGLLSAGVGTSVPSLVYRDNYEFRILSGGEVYHQSLFEKLSFATFKDYVNTLDPFIEYESYNYDSSTLITNTVSWFVEIPDTSFITKDSALLTLSDSNKPSNAEANADVGFVYESVQLDNSYEVNRYDGGFSPLFKNVFTFNSKYKFNVQSTRITVESILDSGLTIDFETGTDTIFVLSTTYTSLDTLAQAISSGINSNDYATATWTIGNDYLDITPKVNNTILVFSNLINVSQSEVVNGNGFKYLDQSNTKFNINVDKFMKLNNFNHIKIANNKILDLESDGEFDPKYELINEIAIGRADYDLLTSNWDYGFHHQYTDKSTKIPKPGTLRIEEDDSFISKLVMLRDTIELELIDSESVKYNIANVPNLSKINIDDFDLVYTENDATIDGILNLGNIITKYLLNDGFSTKFNEFLIKDAADGTSIGTDPAPLKSSSEYIGNFESIEEYIKEYIKLNILKLYEIEKVNFYEKDDRALVESNNSNSNTNAINFEFLSDKDRSNLGYKENKNLRINKSSRLILSFNFAKRLNSGLLISPKVKIKFI